jgi:hypothetical protein
MNIIAPPAPSSSATSTTASPRYALSAGTDRWSASGVAGSLKLSVVGAATSRGLPTPTWTSSGARLGSASDTCSTTPASPSPSWTPSPASSCDMQCSTPHVVVQKSASEQRGSGAHVSTGSLSSSTRSVSQS